MNNLRIKTKTIIILLVIFSLINISVYIISDINCKNRIDLILKEDLNKLQVHFEILNTSQKDISYAISQSILRNTDIIKFLSESYKNTDQQNNLNRKELNNQLKEQYRTAKRQGVLQLQIVNRNNISFLRVHKPSKFGDDLTDIRKDFKIVNETKKSVRGFTQGRTSHGFRNTFPIFDKDKNHIGAIEVSFSSEKYQMNLNNLSKIHSHFLVDKHVFDSNAWKREDLVLKYIQSVESKNLMLTLLDNKIKDKYLSDNKIKLQSYRNMIDKKISKGKKFNFYTKFNDNIEIISFLPIENLSKKTVAWIVSYTKSEIIKSSFKNTLMVRIGSFLISILVIYLLFRQIKSNEKIEKANIESEKQRVLFNEILNTTDNIMLITDFKDILFSNDKFKILMSLNHESDYNEKLKHNMLDNLFIHKDGYLHSGLIKENESFEQVYKNTESIDRKVLILDEKFERKAYSITIQKLINNGDYLVTLSDISKYEDELIKVENKAYIDGLTGVYNRNKFDELFSIELKRVERYNETFSMAIIDIDMFKNFNDMFGHLIGDEVLISIAQIINNNVRQTDVFARWGGEEFIIIFVNTSKEKAKTIAKLLKDKIEENKHPIAGKITASFGITEYIAGDNLDSIFKRCDDALYKAKENGRNRVEVL